MWTVAPSDSLHVVAEMQRALSRVAVIVTLCAVVGLLVRPTLRAHDVTITGTVPFSTLDGSVDDHDGATNGVFTVNDGNLTLDGVIVCNDDDVSPAMTNGCAVTLSVTGDLTLQPNSAILAQNRVGAGNGGAISLTVGGNLWLRSAAGTGGAIVASSSLVQAADGGLATDTAGAVTANVTGTVTTDAGTRIEANSPVGTAGAVSVNAVGRITLAGDVLAGPQTVDDPTGDRTLMPASATQAGGAIAITSVATVGPGVVVEYPARMVSQGENGGGQQVRLEGRGIELRGLAASSGRANGLSRVVLRSGLGILIDGRDIGRATNDPVFAGRRGRAHADLLDTGPAPFRVDLFAQQDIDVRGPDPGLSPIFVTSVMAPRTPIDTGGVFIPALAAVSSSDSGSNPDALEDLIANLLTPGGILRLVSLTGSTTAVGNALEAGPSSGGNKGGVIQIDAAQAVMLTGANLQAIPSLGISPAFGGTISARAFQGALTWTAGAGDVRPVWTGDTPLLPIQQGYLALYGCGTVDITGATFPVIGAPIPPFPTTLTGLCVPEAPFLPPGEPPLDVNQAPTIISGGGVSAAENQTAATDVQSTDPDGETEGAGLTYGLTGGADQALFSIVATTGVLTFNTAPDFENPTDTGGNNVYDVQVTVTDQGGLTDVQDLTVTVTDVNEAPVITSDGGGATAAVNAAENQTGVTTVTATDGDLPAQTLTFAITGGVDQGLFGIGAGTGVLTFNTAPDFENPVDTGANNVYDVQVTVTDDGTPTLTDVQDIAVTVTSANDAPVITSDGGGATAALNAAENQTGVTTVTATDTDLPAQTLTFSISGGADQADFSIGTTGVLSFSAAPDFENPVDTGANNVYDVQVTVTDDGAPTLTDVQDIAVTVTDVNDAPVITSDGGGATAAVNAAENQTAATTVTATDADLPAQTLTFSISGGVDQLLFGIVPGTGVLTFNTAPDFDNLGDAGANNVYDVQVTVTDDGAPVLTDVQDIAVTVTDVNEAPAITSNGGGATASVSVPENQTAATTVAASDPDVPAQTLTFSITGGADQGLFGMVGTTGALTFNAAPDFESPGDTGANNVYDVQVTVTDDGTPTLTDVQDIAVTVTDVNDAPVITSNGGGAIGAAVVPENQTAVTTVTATDTDLPVQTLTFSITGGADQLLFGIVPATGVLTFNTAPDFENPIDAGTNNVYDVQVTVTDDGTPTLTDVQDLAVAVTDVNEPPVLNAIGNLTVNEGGTSSFTASAIDPDAASSATFSLLSGPAGASITSPGGMFTWTPNAAQSPGVFNATVVVTDNGTPGLTDTETIAITVKAAPDFSKSFAAGIFAGGTTTLTFTIGNLAGTFPATGLGFTDILPAPVVVAATPNASTTCTGGAITAIAGTNTIAYAGGAVGAGAVCTVSVDVTSPTAGSFANTSGNLAATVDGTALAGGTASATLVVGATGSVPTFAKVFVPDRIGPGSVSTLTFTITNTATISISSLAFGDTLPAGVTIADPAVASTTCPFATLTAPDGGTTISLGGGSLGPLPQSCTVSVDVTSSTVGTHTNTTGDLTSSAGNSGTATDDLTVATDRLGVTKSFSPSMVFVGGRSTLTFTITKSDAGATFITTLTDNLPTGMAVADPANSSTTCTGGTVTAVPGASVVSLAGGLFLAAGACTVTVDVIGTAAGELNNVTSELMAGPPFVSHGKASDTLEVTAQPIALTKAFTNDPVPPGGTATLEFTIGNPDRDFPATGVGFSDPLAGVLTGLTFGSLLSNDCGGTVTGLGGTTINFAGGTVAAAATCTIRVSLSVPAGAVTGQNTNTTSTIIGTVNGAAVTGAAATDDLFVQPVPMLTKTFLDDPVGAGGTTRLQFTITNTSPTSAATAVAFEDVFNEVLQTASVVPANGSCGAGSILSFQPLINPAGAETIPAKLTLSAGSLAAAGSVGDSCTFQITLDVFSGAAAGTFTNTTAAVSATIDGATFAGPAASDTLTIVAAPRLLKEFTTDPASPGGTVTLQFTLTHDALAPGAATAVTFTDNLAAAITGLAAIGLPLNNLCGAGNGTLAGTVGDTFLTFSGATLNAGETCTFSVTLNVPGAAAVGDHTNTTSTVSATVLGATATENAAADDLRIAGLSLTKEFTDDPVFPGATTNLRFTLANMSAAEGATGIFFSDVLANVLPGSGAADLSVTAPALPASLCGGTLSDVGGGLLFFIGGALAAGDPPCMFDLTLLVPTGTADGSYTNTTSDVTAIVGGSALQFDPAIDTLVVDSDQLSLTKEFTDDPVAPGGTATLRFTLTNLDATQAASGIGFTDDLGVALSGLVATTLPTAGAACNGSGTVTGTSALTFSGGALAAGASCFFDVTVSVPSGLPPGTVAVNTTSGVTGTIGGFAVTGDPAIDTLRVDQFTFTKAFDGPTTAGGTPMLTFTIQNQTTTTFSGLRFADDLTALVPALPGFVATGLPLNNVCNGSGTISGTTILTFSGGSLAGGASCSFSVPLAVPGGTAAGAYINTTTDLTDSGIAVATPATATLTVTP